MSNPSRQARVSRHLLTLACVASLATPHAWSQTTPAAEKPAPVEKKDASTEAAKPATPTAQTPTPAKQEVESGSVADILADSDTIILSPFEVVSSNNGYMATNTASGTRLNSRLEDLASPITVITKQQLTDMAAVDLNDIFRTESNVEGLYQYTETGMDRNQVVDVASNNPEANNRIRGMGQANLTANGMAISSAIPIDAYNVDSLEIARGANSNIFGIGSTSGTVNLNLATANMTRDTTKFSFMTDNLGRLRETFDVNRMLIRNKLALRVLGAHDELGFVREPSSSKTKRFTIAMRAQPFRATSLKVSYETYRNSQSLPNVLTPREAITSWRNEGSHTWDPSTFTLYDGSGAAVGQFTGAPGAPVGQPGAPGATALLSLYGFRGGSGDSSNQRPIAGYIDGQIAYLTGTGAWRWGSRNATTQVNTYTQTGDQRLVDYNFPAVQIYVPDINPATGQPYGLLASAFNEQLVGVHGDAGKAFYDWENVNLLAANHSWKASNILRAELEHSFLPSSSIQQLALQIGFSKEDVENKSYNYIGNGGDGVQLIIYPDVNRTLPNGDPNPGYGRPMIRARQPQIYYRPEENLTEKAQLAYQIDLTQSDRWWKWLGKHNLLGYAEYRERRFSPGSLRYRSQIASGENLINGIGNSDSLNTRYYLGDASGFNLDSPTSSPPTAGLFPYTYWSTEFGGTGSVVTNGGAQWRDTDIRIIENYFANGTQKNEVRSQGLIWQGFLLDGRIIPTLGWREERVRFMASMPYTVTVGGVTSAVTATPYQVEGYPNSTFYDPTSGLFRFNDDYILTNPRAGANERYGSTRTQGVVVKPFLGLTKFSFLNGLSFSYNRSASFDPSGLAIDTYGEIVDDPTGKSEDYGVRFSMLNERLWISLNRYKAETINSRNGGANVVATRALPFDFDTNQLNPDDSFGGISSVNQLDLFDWYFYRIYGQTSTPAGQPAGTIPPPDFNASGDPVYLSQNNLIGATDAETRQRVTDHVYGLMGFDKGIITKRNNAPGATPTATNDVTSKGYELEILYRTTNLNLKLTGAKKETIDSNVAISLKNYIEERRPILEAASYTNLTRGDGQPVSYWTTNTGTGTSSRRDQYYAQVMSVYLPLLANEGKARPQVREYSVSLTGSYALAGISSNSFLRNMRVGGNVSWVSKGSIGYGYATPTYIPPTTPTGTGTYQLLELDASKRFYDKARYSASAWAAYDFRWFSGRVKSSVQFNVQNLLEDGRLQRVGVRTDGVAWNYRIIDPRVYQLTLNFEL
jgi:hypothetical protein